MKFWTKSKTLDSLIFAAILLVLSIIGVGESTPGKTWDSIGDMTGQIIERAKEFFIFFAICYAFYGRVVAKGEITFKKKEADDENKD